MSKRPVTPPPRHFALFVEGPDTTDIEGTYWLDLLWRELARHCRVKPRLSVHGFSKGQIELLLPEADPVGLATVPLDILIDARHRQDPFEHAVIAFDRIPVNRKIPHSSLRSEVNWILERFVARRRLPQKLLTDAVSLLAHYKATPCPPRNSGHPPRFSLELIYMNPMFEALLVCDESAVKQALGIDKKPKDWPTFDPFAQHPDRDILARAVKFASQEVRKRVRGSFKTNKHGWAHQIVRSASGSRIFQHEISTRLCLLLQ